MERKKLIIEARINEYMMREHNLHAPWTPEEIARPALEARETGATIVHWHARQPDGSPCHDATVYARTIELIRARRRDAVGGRWRGLGRRDLPLLASAADLQDPRRS